MFDPKTELSAFCKEFVGSDYRYLHISGHGAGNRLYTTIDWFGAEQLAKMLKPQAEKRRIFFSSCGSEDSMAQTILEISNCLSVLAPIGTICFDDAAIFRIAFYHLMFEREQEGMKTKVLLESAQKCADLIEMPFKVWYQTTNGLKIKEVGPRGDKWKKCQKD